MKLSMQDFTVCIICSIPSVMSIFYYFRALMDWNRKKHIVLFLWLLSLLNDYSVMMINRMVDSIWISSAVTFVVVFAISLFFEADGVIKVVFSIMYTSIQILVSSLVIGGFNVLFNSTNQAQNYISSIISRWVLLLFVMVFYICMKKTYVGRLPWKINCMLLIIPIGSLIIIQTIFMKEYIFNLLGINGIICICIILIINGLVFKLYNRLSEYLEIKYKNMLYEKEFELLSLHDKEKKAYMSEFSKNRHDLKHKMTELLLLLNEKKYDELENKIREFADMGFLSDKKISHTGNDIVDSFLNSKYNIALKYQVRFNARMDIPRELPFLNSDLCVVLGNTLDNAIEACLRGNIREPYIDFLMKYDGDNLLITVKNSFDGKLSYNDGKILTRKKDKYNHGMGISSIKNVAEKYNGYCNVEISNNEYSLQILMYG